MTLSPLEMLFRRPGRNASDAGIAPPPPTLTLRAGLTRPTRMTDGLQQAVAKGVGRR